jgi:ribosomal protein L7Ae-like RNA K-turn-binding protein
MESFKITTELDYTKQELLVIPDDCNDKSIFHVVKNGSELCKLIYTDRKLWEIMDDGNIRPEEMEELTKKIEEYYF